jgi:glucan phosphoethanolaminetransferase (alkaline phosphatase superfamily)
MLQRIQTLYLLAATVLMSLVLFLPLAEIAPEGIGYYSVVSKGWYLTSGEITELAMATWPVFILALVLALLPLINIFLYKNRKLQLRISVYSIILAFGLIGLIYYYFVIGFRQLDEPVYVLRFPLVVPAIFIILIYLAFRGIRKDEILVRSMDRIR